MIITTKIDRFNNTVVINRKYRFKNPEMIIKTWYGLKIWGANRWYRAIINDTELYDRIVFQLDLNKEG